MTAIGILLLLMAVTVASVLRPAAAFGFVALMLPAEQLLQAGFPVFAAVPWLGNVLLALIPLLGVVVLVAKGEFGLRSYLHPLLIATVLLYAWLGVTTLWAPDQIVAFDSLRVGVPYALVFILLSPALIRSLEDSRVAMRTMMFVGLGLGLLMLQDPNFEVESTRLGASMGNLERTNPLEIGGLGGRLLLLSSLGAVLLTGWFGLPLRAAALVVGAGLGILSGSRGQVIFAVLLAVALYPVSRRIVNFSAFVLTALGVLVLGGALYFGASLFVGADNEERWSSESIIYGGTGRWDNAIDLLSAYLNSPGSWLQGLGYQAFGSLPTSSGDSYSHVSLVDSLAEAGVLGFALYVGICAGGFYAWLALFRSVKDDPQDRALATLLLAFFLYNFLIANKQGTVWSAFHLYLMAVVIGRCAADHFERLASVSSTEPGWVDDGRDVPALSPRIASR